jgi:hypothetical protein
MQLVVAEGRHEECPAVAQPPHEVVEELQGGTIGPVDILQDDDEGFVATIEDTADRLVEPSALLSAQGAARARRVGRGRGRGERVRAGIGRVGAVESRKLAQPVEGLDERGEGEQVRPELEAAASYDGHTIGGGPARELRDESRLPDAGLTADETAGSSRAVGQGILKPGELALATQERGTGLPRRYEFRVGAARPFGKSDRES